MNNANTSDRAPRTQLPHGHALAASAGRDTPLYLNCAQYGDPVRGVMPHHDSRPIG